MVHFQPRKRQAPSLEPENNNNKQFPPTFGTLASFSGFTAARCFGCAVTFVDLLPPLEGFMDAFKLSVFY